MATTYGSAQFVALRLLPYLGIYSLSTAAQEQADNSPGLQPTTLDDLGVVITAGCQEIYDDAPSDICEQRLSVNLHAPTVLTLTVTANSASATAVSGWASWMLGCRCNGADGYLNEIIGYTSAGTLVTLMRPYAGSTGSASFTVYQDAIRLDSNSIANLANGLTVRNVIDPVELQGRRLLIADTDRVTFYNRGGFLPYAANSIVVNEPSHYFVDSRYDPTTATLAKYLRISPAPGQFWPVTFRARVDPKVITATDIGDSTTDPATIIPLPAGTIESILLPFCKQILSGSAEFRNSSALPEIARARESARGRLASLRPGIALSYANSYPLGLQ